MANNNYILNGSSLTSIADAIRSKSGSSQKLTFPDEFVSAINNISTGMEPTFKIVGGTAQPSSPTENTLWVNTSTNITSWAFSSEQPSSASNGMVWIVTGTYSNIKFDAINANTMYMYPISAKQYINNAWVDVALKAYQSGKWNENIITLYSNGNTCSEITGGWSASGYNSAYGDNTGFSMTSTHLVCRSISGSSTNKTGIGGTVNPIRISGKKYLKISGTFSNYRGSSLYDVGLLSAKGSTNNPVLYTRITGANGGFEKTLDISSINGSYYVYVQAAVSSDSATYESYMYVNKITLE